MTGFSHSPSTVEMGPRLDALASSPEHVASMSRLACWCCLSQRSAISRLARPPMGLTAGREALGKPAHDQ